MNLTFRLGTHEDLQGLKHLGIKAWTPFQKTLTAENWDFLQQTISNEKTYEGLLSQSTSFVCVTENDTIIGMAYIVPNGHPTDIYLKEWSYIRFVSVDPTYGGQGIGKKLTQMCIDFAIKNGERTIALHTSEMMDNARHIYETLGFKILRELDQRLGKRYWLYVLELGVDKEKTKV